MRFVLGTARPPNGWPDEKPMRQDILKALASGGYAVPEAALDHRNR
jgi:hypothetical protein